MAKISVSLDDELLAELKEAAGSNVSGFIASAVRRQLRRKELEAFLSELEQELGPPSEDDLAEAAAAFDRAETAGPRSGGRPRRSA
jgi:Arc/MetJ-type ribon-helix-helix transcriptional regulator